MNNARAALSGGGGGIFANVIYVLVSFLVVYMAYRLVYPQQDPREALVTEFTDGTTSASAVTDVNNNKLPNLFTGGECTLSFWMYVSDWEVRSGQMKHVVTVKGQGSQNNSIVIGMYPMENKLMIRLQTANTSAPSSTGANVSPTLQMSGSKYTELAAYTSLFTSGTGLKDFMNTVNYPVCDLPEFDLQRWVCVTLVVNGRVCDVYLDGKLSRSCMLDNIIQFPKTTTSACGIQVDTCQFGGFGGALSRVQLFSYAITPDRAYTMYQAGPTLKSNTLVDKLLALFGINLTYSAYKVTPPAGKCDNGSTTVSVPNPIATGLTNLGMTTGGTTGNLINTATNRVMTGSG